MLASFMTADRNKEVGACDPGWIPLFRLGFVVPKGIDKCSEQSREKLRDVCASKTSAARASLQGVFSLDHAVYREL